MSSKKESSNKEVKKSKKLGALPIALLVVFVLSIFFSKWSNPQIAPDEVITGKNSWITGETLIVANQGGRKLRPENTMKAFKETITQKNAQIIKVDVRATKDNVVVACRPLNINSVSDAGKVFDKKFCEVKNYTYDELSKLNFGYKFSDVTWNKPYHDIEGVIPSDLKIVRLSELLDLIKNVPEMRVMIDIRESGDDSKSTVDAVCEMLKSRNMTSSAVLKADDYSVSKYIEYRYPEISRTANSLETSVFYFSCQIKRDLPEDKKYVAVVFPQRFGVITLSTQKLVNYAHENEIAIVYESVNKAVKFDYLKNIGADAVITDNSNIAISN